MVSDELRKKWGTIFMGEREASLEQIDAMQEPIFRERNRKEQEQAYLDRVKLKATERAKSILGEAYSERQKVLQEARIEAEKAHAKLLDQAKQIQVQAQEEKDAAAQELVKAREIRLEAEQIKEQARDEGYQAGIAQANEELKVFRGEMGQGFATILQLVGNQLENISESWREELVLLVQTAIAAATGWVLDSRHEAIMRALVIEAVSLLEQRATVTVRVNPQDEALVRDMFKAAKEKAPEIKQWVVTADESVACGGLIAESGSGSVDCRREHFKELVDGILTHLALPEGEEDIARAMKIHEATLEQARQFLPQPEESAPEVSSPSEDLDPLGDLPQESEEPQASFMADTASTNAVEAEPFVAQVQESLPVVDSNAISTESVQEFAGSCEAEAAPLASLDHLDGMSVQQDAGVVHAEDLDAVPEAWLPPLGEDEQSGNTEENIPPSLNDLEEELFPLEDSEDSNVLAQGGFLSGDNGRAG